MERPRLEPEDALSGPPLVPDREFLLRIDALGDTSPIRRLAPWDPLREAFPKAVPAAGLPLEEVVGEIERGVVPYARRNAHPGFFAYVCSPGLPTDPFAHAIGAVLNQNVTGFDSAPGATVLEQTVVEWMRDLVGMPETAGGLFHGGGSAANLMAVTTAFHAAHPEAREGGVGVARMPRAYASTACHFSVKRALTLMGLGSGALRSVPVDGAFRMDPEALAAAITEDVDQGFRPFCVVASAGTTTTGAIDPLHAVADVAERFGVWMHVDAAYGGGALLAPELRDRFDGIGRADSVTIDLHKWMFLAFDASVLLMRRPRAAQELYAVQADYVLDAERRRPEDLAYYHGGPETSRRFRALPAYVALRHYGADRLARNIAHQVRCAAYLAERVRESDELELLHEPELSICCFRRVPPAHAGDVARVDRLNEGIRTRLEHSGGFLLSPTRLGGRPVLRVCILSSRTTADDVDALVEAVLAADV